VRSLSLAGRHGLALLPDGGVACFGDALCGPSPAKTPTRISSLGHVVEVAVARQHACAILHSETEHGSVACWGANDVGQLGDGSKARHDAPVTVSGIADAVQLAVAEKTSCARHANGTVSCWGANDFGQLGDGTTLDRATPLRIPGLSHATQIAVGGSHACALLDDGSAQCWGSNASGELGDRTRNSRSIRGPVLF
jgi:alpha-tubulin suppressor-like RCC1 family protein